MNIPDLEALIENIDWDEFQEPSDGNIYFWCDGKIKFAYRIGLHLKRPMEAIMAKGEFVRMRAAPTYVDFELNRLDPDNVDKCLYRYNTVRDGKDWMPKVSKTWLTQQQAMLQAQQALQAAQLPGLYGGGNGGGGGAYGTVCLPNAQPIQPIYGGSAGGSGTCGSQTINPQTTWISNTTGVTVGGNAAQAQAQALTQYNQPGLGHSLPNQGYQGLLSGLASLGGLLSLGGKW